MINFIRNAGWNQSPSDEEILLNELKFWGIDKDFFKPAKKSKFEIIQEELEKPFTNLFDDDAPERDSMSKLFEENKINFKDLCERSSFGFDQNFELG